MRRQLQLRIDTESQEASGDAEKQMVESLAKQLDLLKDSLEVCTSLWLNYVFNCLLFTMISVVREAACRDDISVQGPSSQRYQGEIIVNIFISSNFDRYFTYI